MRKDNLWIQIETWNTFELADQDFKARITTNFEGISK
jgi:hypothetical protein